eukprot:CAMPEP_0119560938 /NCGR_PEP_ID=MMETSP1352-20130426/16232_1 /TAXON_ID=265584 /ORGANISM="Stauroneis constricta, Strain CCMP1120" /LENGTH=293 /DNA_ID=CAMNT_0007609019 /DNA_START=140 /DNA_END=1021 /DNA_ORIENTATION=+
MKSTAAMKSLAFLAIIAMQQQEVSAFFPSSILSAGLSSLSKTKIHPQLCDIVNAQDDTVLQITLNIGQQLGIQGLTFEFHTDGNDDVVPLPGINGPHPHLSSGARQLIVQKEGGFVSMAGAQHVKMDHACWEMVWKEDAPAGSLICGFEIMDDYKRNEVTLPKGRAYISFPIWTTEGLKMAREHKDRALGFVKDKNDALDKFQQESNPIRKALQYREACLAAEKCSLYPVKNYDIVPDEDETVQIPKHQDNEEQQDIWLTTKGLIWSKEAPHQILLGSANIVKSSFVSDDHFN